MAWDQRPTKMGGGGLPQMRAQRAAEAAQEALDTALAFTLVNSLTPAI